MYWLFANRDNSKSGTKLRIIAKKLIIFLDNLIEQPIQKFLYRIKFRKSIELLGAMYDRKFIVNLSSTSRNKFAELCDKYGSDKGTCNPFNTTHPWPSHTYSDFYDLFFSRSRLTYRNILECGIGTSNPNFLSNMSLKGKPGASLRVLRDYFPEANVYGVDIDRSVLFEELRIKTFQMDQTDNVSIAQFVEKIYPVQFDLIIDDGLHTFEAAINLFEAIQNCLSTDFVYIIEDVYGVDLGKFIEYFAGRAFSMQVIQLYRPKGIHNMTGDNNLIFITSGTLRVIS